MNDTQLTVLIFCTFDNKDIKGVGAVNQIGLFNNVVVTALSKSFSIDI